MAAWPDEAELEGWLTSLSNRGRWGEGDGLGTLNLITPATRAAAAATVTEGVAVSCALDLSTAAQPGDAHGPARRYLVRSGQSTAEPRGSAGRLTGFGERYDACAEYVGLVFHGPNVTHLDALCHTVWDGSLYNGVPVAAVSVERGADALAVTEAMDGVVARGVLIDAARAAGERWLEPGTPVHASDLDAIAAAQNVDVRPGDALLLRTGLGRRRRESPADHVGAWAGWHPDCLPWFRERGIAVVGSDGFNETLPNPYDAVRLPIHIVGQVALGLWLLDNLDLEAASEQAQRTGRWSFLFVVAPLRIPGGTGSPVNPVAVW